ncbi:hypothetical protein M8J75_008594 [Diaphorina citri]|nr:hypothetical protein M8J75_008594 [Diaphorina citri]
MSLVHAKLLGRVNPVSLLFEDFPLIPHNGSQLVNIFLILGCTVIFQNVRRLTDCTENMDYGEQYRDIECYG